MFLPARALRQPRRRLAHLVAPVAHRSHWWLRHPWRAVGLATVVGAAAGQVSAGPVAGLVVAAYGAAAVRWSISRRLTRLRADAYRRACDAVGALAADLRTGLPPAAAMAAARPLLAGAADDPLTAPVVAPVEARVAAAWWLADTIGTPVADLLDRLDVDLRSLSRARSEATAQAAGAQATAVLLAALPAVGILLGYGVGADPVHVLLHTRAGAACAVAAVALQLAGLAWSQRLVGAVAAVGSTR